MAASCHLSVAASCHRSVAVSCHLSVAASCRLPAVAVATCRLLVVLLLLMGVCVRGHKGNSSSAQSEPVCANPCPNAPNAMEGGCCPAEAATCCDRGRGVMYCLDTEPCCPLRTVICTEKDGTIGCCAKGFTCGKLTPSTIMGAPQSGTTCFSTADQTESSCCKGKCCASEKAKCLRGKCATRCSCKTIRGRKYPTYCFEPMVCCHGNCKMSCK